MQTNCLQCTFGNESWSILSDIERSINAKIEAIGTPLKDWDIQINYGIKTGFNDAFIIDSVKREEILNACQNEEERQRTAEIIRPVFYSKMSFPPNLLHRGHNLTCDRLLMLPGTITGSIVVQQ